MHLYIDVPVLSLSNSFFSMIYTTSDTLHHLCVRIMVPVYSAKHSNLAVVRKPQYMFKVHTIYSSYCKPCVKIQGVKAKWF